MSLLKNDIVTLEITDFNVTGAGVGKTDGVPVFVSGAVIGDTVRAKITKVLRNYAYARMEEVVRPSPDRTEPACPVFSQCGGCQFQAYDYDAQLRYKERRVKEALVRIGGFEEAHLRRLMKPAHGMEEPYRYRNKAQYPAGRSPEGQTVFGFYAPHSHRIVPTADCLLGPPENRKILAAVKESMRIADVDAYRETDRSGYVRHVLIRKGFATGRIMVCLVVNGEAALSRFRDVLILQLAEIGGVASVCFNYNTADTNVILGAETEYIYGKPFIEDMLCGLTFRISARSFYQVNPAMTQELYEAVAALAFYGSDGTEGKPVVWDLYCGLGTISLSLARAGAKMVYGVEMAPEAVENAKENARLNGIENVSFLCGKAEDITTTAGAAASGDDAGTTADLPMSAGGVKTEESLSDTEKLMLPPPDVVVVDPPRAGCEKTLLETILRTAPERIVYVSCDPATLARDLRILVDGGYALREIEPYDMFAQTVHVETVVLMSRAKE